MINFTIYGNPKALKRHRSGKWGNYDPSAVDKADFLTMAMQHRPDKPFEGPVMLKVQAFFQRPKNHYRTGKYSDQLKLNAPIWHTTKPDHDNVTKFICDALNGVFWCDDSIICCSSINKFYDDVPRLEIIVSKMIGAK